MFVLSRTARNASKLSGGTGSSYQINLIGSRALPAAIALAQRYNLDSRDGGSDERAEAIFSHEGIWECTFVGECTQVCPKNVDPAAAINQAKFGAVIDWAKGLVLPRGGTN